MTSRKKQTPRKIKRRTAIAKMQNQSSLGDSRYFAEAPWRECALRLRDGVSLASTFERGLFYGTFQKSSKCIYIHRGDVKLCTDAQAEEKTSNCTEDAAPLTDAKRVA